MPFKETLPQNCPPSNAIKMDGKIIYRLVKSNPPTINDFNCWLKDNPAAYTSDECKSRACSVSSTLDGLKTALKFSSRLRAQCKFFAILLVDSNAGLFLGDNHKDHIEWWLFSDTNPLVYIQETHEVI